MSGAARTRAWWGRRLSALAAVAAVVALVAASADPPPPSPAAAEPSTGSAGLTGEGAGSDVESSEDGAAPASASATAPPSPAGSDVVAFGGAQHHGGTRADELTAPVVGMAATPTGDGYWEVAGDGGIFAFGDARFSGSTGAIRLNRPIVGMAATPTGDGYWLVASDGGIFAFGDARFSGSLAGTDLADRAAVAVVAAPAGDGYWLVLGERRLELPRGGRTLFPDWRVVAHYGGPQSARLGILGNGTPEEAARRLAEQAAAYEGFGRPVLPAFELIATIATSAAGSGGRYSAPLAEAQIQRYLDAARAQGLLLVLDVQPGRAPFLEEVKRHERFLREPDVGLALDPEWSLRAPAVPGSAIGSTDAATINEVSAWLARIVAEEGLPEKLFVVHQFTAGMVRDRHLVVDRPGLATTFHVDGFGGRGAKRSKYQQLHPEAPFASGFKLFYTQDVDLLTPTDVMTTLSPPPDLVTYQ